MEVKNSIFGSKSYYINDSGKELHDGSESENNTQCTEESNRVLRIRNLRKATQLEALAKKYCGRINTLVLDNPTAKKYFQHLHKFGNQLAAVNLENLQYLPKIDTQKNGEISISNVLLRVTQTKTIDGQFANFIRFLGVKKIDFSRINLVMDSFWEDLGEQYLQELQTLSISGTELTKDFFREYLPKMINLQELSLSAFASKMDYQWEIFDVSALVKLEKLKIDNVPLSSLPRGFTKLESLKQLDLSNLPMRKFVKAEDSTYKIISKLNVLNILYTEINELPNFQESLHLIEFRMCNSEVANLPPSFYSSKLEVLELSNSHIHSIDSGEFMRLDKLRKLDLSFSSISSLPSEVSCQNSIQEINLRGLDNLTELPEWIADCPNLRSLNLEHTKVNELSPKLLLKRCWFYDWDKKDVKQDDYCNVFIEGLQLKSIDREVLLENNDVLREAYVKAQKKKPLNRGNIVIIGDPNVGKGKLAEAITGTNTSNWNNCYGFSILDNQLAYGRIMDIARSHYSKSERRDWSNKDYTPVKVRIIRMSGYSSAQLLHPFFFTNHSLYIVVLDDAQSINIQAQATYWARMVECYAPNAHIVFAIWSENTSCKVLNIPLLQQSVYLDSVPDVVYLEKGTSINSKDTAALCRIIVKRIQNLMPASVLLPESWIDLINHFEQLLEARDRLPGTIFDKLGTMYKLPIKGNTTYYQKYLLSLESDTIGKLTPVTDDTDSSLADTEQYHIEDKMLYHSEWLAEGLYRLMEYAQKNNGIIESAQRLWSFLVDSTKRPYSIAQSKSLLEFCADDNRSLCYKTNESQYVFPSFLNNLQDNLQADLSQYKKHYVIQCPLLTQTMIDVFATKVREWALKQGTPQISMGICGFQIKYYEKCSEQTEKKENERILVLGKIAETTTLHLFLSVDNHDDHSLANKHALALLGIWYDHCLKKLPDYLKNQFQPMQELSKGSQRNPRYTNSALISLKEVQGLRESQYTQFFSGILRHAYQLTDFLDYSSLNVED